MANEGGLSPELVASLLREAESAEEVTRAEEALPRQQATPERGLENFHELSVTFKVQIGQTRRSLKEWLDVGVGSRISLEESWRQPVHLYINNHRVGSGTIVLVGNRFGVRVTEWGNGTA